MACVDALRNLSSSYGLNTETNLLVRLSKMKVDVTLDFASLRTAAARFLVNHIAKAIAQIKLYCAMELPGA